MATRITQRNLDAIAHAINLAVGAPEHYTPRANNEGHFYFSSAYGGYKLVRIANPQGGESDVMSSGHIPMRQAYNEAVAFHRGILYAQKLAKQKGA